MLPPLYQHLYNSVVMCAGSHNICDEVLKTASVSDFSSIHFYIETEVEKETHREKRTMLVTFCYRYVLLIHLTCIEHIMYEALVSQQ